MEGKFEFITILQPTSLYSCRKKKNSSAILQFPSLTPPVSILYTFQNRFFIFFSRCLILNSLTRYTGRSFFFIFSQAPLFDSEWVVTRPNILRPIHPQFIPSLSSCFYTFSHLQNDVFHKAFKFVLQFISAERKKQKYEDKKL